MRVRVYIMVFLFVRLINGSARLSDASLKKFKLIAGDGVLSAKRQKKKNRPGGQ